MSAPDSRQVRRYYRRGMYVICVVISQGKCERFYALDENEYGNGVTFFVESHRLVLSLRPSLINAGYSFALLRPGMVSNFVVQLQQKRRSIRTVAVFVVDDL